MFDLFNVSGLLLTCDVSNTFLGVAQSLAKIGSSLKPKHHGTVTLVQIPDTHGTIFTGTVAKVDFCLFKTRWQVKLVL